MRPMAPPKPFSKEGLQSLLGSPFVSGAAAASTGSAHRDTHPPTRRRLAWMWRFCPFLRKWPETPSDAAARGWPEAATTANSPSRRMQMIRQCVRFLWPPPCSLTGLLPQGCERQAQDIQKPPPFVQATSSALSSMVQQPMYVVKCGL